MITSLCRRAPVWSCVLALLLLVPGTIAAQTTAEKLASAPPIVRVEEDWEVLVADPDPNVDVPQIVTVFGPTNSNFGTHVVFELNHGTLPSYAAGGMQLQVWWGSLLMGYQSQRAPTELNLANELIRFTTVTRLKDDTLKMSIINGTSQTWGNFGGTSSLAVSLSTNRDDLNPYDPDNSLQQSRVTFGANRVSHFCRNSIRFYSADGLFLQDDTVQYVHRLAYETAAAP